MEAVSTKRKNSITANSNPMPPFYAQLKAARKAARLKQHECATRFHVSLSIWQKWEQGRNSPLSIMQLHLLQSLGEIAKNNSKE